MDQWPLCLVFREISMDQWPLKVRQKKSTGIDPWMALVVKHATCPKAITRALSEYCSACVSRIVSFN